MRKSTRPVGSPLPAETQIDCWVTPLEDGTAVATGVNAAVRALGFVLLSQIPSAWSSHGDGVLMSGTLADTTNVWLVPISPKTWKVSSAPAVAQVQPAVSRDGKLLAFSSRRSGSWAIWVKDLVTGKETAIANTPWPEFYPLSRRMQAGLRIARTRSSMLTRLGGR